MDKALDAAVDATRRHSFDALTMDEHRDIVSKAITAYLAALPATDTSGLVERLRAIDEEAMYEAPATSEAVILQAADRIETLERGLAEAAAVIRPFAEAASYHMAFGDNRPVRADGDVLVGHLRAARSYLEGRK